jgi:dipeptidase
MRNTIKCFVFALLIIANALLAQSEKADWIEGFPDACTTITLGKKATTDGSVITSHTDDSHRTRSWVNIVPAKDHSKDETVVMYRREKDDLQAMPAYKHIKIGEIPQVSHTYQYINTAYPSMNEKQLGIGESTFGGREELQSDNGLIDAQRLCQLMLERCTTAREAIALADQLTQNYGWNDSGECLTIADKNEVWHFEIVGPGKGKKGAVWVAQRVPDDHVSVNANASRIRKIDIRDKEYFMASQNVFQVAKENGWWNPEEGEFEFCYAYAPHGRSSVAASRREWRVFDLLAPSLKLNPEAENFPFSVKPDTLVSMEKLISVFQDYYEGTPYDMTQNLRVKDKEGKSVVSPLANPFMPYDANRLHRINGGWGWLGERTIARWYTMYATIIQLRSNMPDDIGGVEWLAMDNVATSIYIPVYAGTTDLPEAYKTPGRTKGYTLKSAWWAFNRLGTLTAQRWGEARYDVQNVWKPMQKEIFDEQRKMESVLVKSMSMNPRKILTGQSLKWGKKVVRKAIELGDSFWTKYDEKF